MNEKKNKWGIDARGHNKIKWGTMIALHGEWLEEDALKD